VSPLFDWIAYLDTFIILFLTSKINRLSGIFYFFTADSFLFGKIVL